MSFLYLNIFALETRMCRKSVTLRLGISANTSSSEYAAQAPSLYPALSCYAPAQTAYNAP